MKALWGGRFKKGMHPLLKAFSYSLSTDSELLEAELRVNEAYAKMLVRVKLLTRREAARILKGLKQIQKDWKPGDGCRFHRDYEDIHTFIQQKLEQKAGTAAKKIHTGRSRNDLVATSTRLYLREKLQLISQGIAQTQAALVDCAKKYSRVIMPGLTHLQKAQPVLLAHHLLAYVEMLEEDKNRLKDASKRLNVLVLGSAALAGSALPLDQKFLAKELGFSRIAANSMAAVSDRAFLAEVLSGLAILWTHFSRLAEDFILWNSEAFGFVQFDDAFATGSSLMPQKKNPDVFELLRGRSAVIFGELMALLALQKGLPLTYNRDLQEDKPALFSALRKTELALALLPSVLRTSKFQPKRMAEALNDQGIYATDVLDYLVRKKVPFSEAHEKVGQIVRYAVGRKSLLSEVPLKVWKSFCPAFGPDVLKLFSPLSSVRGKQTLGSTHPAKVQASLERWEKQLSSRKK